MTRWPAPELAGTSVLAPGLTVGGGAVVGGSVGSGSSWTRVPCVAARYDGGTVVVVVAGAVLGAVVVVVSPCATPDAPAPSTTIVISRHTRRHIAAGL